jgi:hypothetical protein
VGLGEQSQEVLVTKVMSSKRSRDRWVSTKVLIVDEVVRSRSVTHIASLVCAHSELSLTPPYAQSMLEGTLFDKLEYVARKVRNYDAPFGGIQLVLSGDFLQVRTPIVGCSPPSSSSPSSKPWRSFVIKRAVAAGADQVLLLRVGGVEEGGARGDRPHSRLSTIRRRLCRSSQRPQVRPSLPYE